MNFHLRDETLYRIASGDDALSPRARRHLAACAECREQVAFVRSLPAAVAAAPDPEPGAALRDRIMARAAAHERVVLPALASPRHRAPALPWAIAVVVTLAIGGGWWLDRSHERRELAELRATIAALPATSRYQMIANTGDSAIGNSRIVAALTTSLLSDPNTNVRVAAAAALGRIATPAALRQAAEASIQSDPSPFVQTALLAATARLSVADRAAILRALLARPDLDPVVRAEAEQHSRT